MNKLFQQRLNELLSKKLYTYEELSEKLGIKSKGTITKYVNGQIKNPNISTIEKIAKLYNVSPAWLIGLSENKYDNINSDKYVKIKILNGESDDGIIISTILADSNDYIAFNLKDDSLSPKLLKGDKLLIKCQSTFETEDICAIDYNNEIILRKISKTDIGLILKPLNTNYETIVCLEKDIKNLKILGIVIKSERFFK